MDEDIGISCKINDAGWTIVSTGVGDGRPAPCGPKSDGNGRQDMLALSDCDTKLVRERIPGCSLRRTR